MVSKNCWEFTIRILLLLWLARLSTRSWNHIHPIPHLIAQFQSRHAPITFRCAQISWAHTVYLFRFDHKLSVTDDVKFDNIENYEAAKFSMVVWNVFVPFRVIVAIWVPLVRCAWRSGTRKIQWRMWALNHLTLMFNEILWLCSVGDFIACEILDSKIFSNNYHLSHDETSKSST